MRIVVDPASDSESLHLPEGDEDSEPEVPSGEKFIKIKDKNKIVFSRTTAETSIRLKFERKNCAYAKRICLLLPRHTKSFSSRVCKNFKPRSKTVVIITSILYFAAGQDPFFHT